MPFVNHLGDADVSKRVITVDRFDTLATTTEAPDAVGRA